MLHPRSLSCFMAIFISLAGHWVSAADQKTPNVLVILCDDLGYGDLSCFGHPTIQTPHLDQLADEGMRLTSCYSASPLCSPARAGLMTGRIPTRSGIYSWIAPKNPMYLKRDETTIATLLKQSGYETCHVGKWHLNGLFNDPAHTQPNDHGFDHWFSTHNNAGPSHENPKNFVRNGEPVGEQTGFSCQLVADEAIRWLNDRDDAATPFFMFVCFHEPHEPIASPEDLVQEYPDAKKRGEALYYANVSNMDKAVGRIVEAVDNQNLGEETLIVFTSDNGPETLNRYQNAWRSHGSPGPLRGMKLHVYEGGIRVPGIVRWTGTISPGQVSDVPVGSVDLLPTVCELVDIELPTSKILDGTSLVKLWNGAEIEREEPLFWHYYGGTGNRQFALRDGDWKIVAQWSGGSDMPSGGSLQRGVVPKLKSSSLEQFELYHISEDIAEEHEVSASHPEVFDRLTKLAKEKYSEIIEEGPYWFEDGAESNN